MKEYIEETKTLQINKEYYISYYYSNTIEERTYFTLYRGDICTPEYSTEIIHIAHGGKRYTDEEVIEYGKALLKNIKGLCNEEV